MFQTRATSLFRVDETLRVLWSGIVTNSLRVASLRETIYCDGRSLGSRAPLLHARHVQYAHSLGYRTASLDFKVKYVPGKLNVGPNALSC